MATSVLKQNRRVSARRTRRVRGDANTAWKTARGGCGDRILLEFAFGGLEMAEPVARPVEQPGIPLGRVFGIPLYLHLSWFIIFLLITVSLATQFTSQHPGWTREQHWLLGIFTSFLFFASVVFHELSHSVVAKAYKIPVQSITLFVFGGLSRITREPANGKQEFNVAIAGPLLGGLAVFRGQRNGSRGGRMVMANQSRPSAIQPGSGIPARRRPRAARDRLGHNGRFHSCHKDRGEFRQVFRLPHDLRWRLAGAERQLGWRPVAGVYWMVSAVCRAG
jgi:hypothetical protein